MTLPRNGIDRNNVIAAFLMGALPAVGGSVISFMLYSFFVWGLMSLALKRFEFQMTRSDRALAWTFTAFAALIVLTALIGPNRSEIPHSIVWLLAFLSPWVVIPRLRASRGIDLLQPYIIGAAIGVTAAALLAFVQSSISGIRAEGGAGNAAVFSMMSLCLMGIGGLNIASPSKTREVLAISAVVGGIVALSISLTRGVGLMIFPILALLVIFAPARWRFVVMRPLSGLVVAVAAIALYNVQRLLDGRWNETLRELHRLLTGVQTTRGIGERLRLWRAGWDAFFDSPVWGHGIQNRMTSLIPELSKDGLPIRGFTHAHNGFLSFALDGGIITLAALAAVLCVPVFIAWRAPRDPSYRTRLFLALILFTAYVGCGMTQIMFKHDIMDAFFIFCALLIAASIPANPGLAHRMDSNPPSA
ncbi:hypothetical protein ASD64_04490 [Mesorhizobium sp. Root157]|uniref:O-antigen ligase family protein n=1 Tax=Mesorhizobium sp. Root157 TaxID=1736477 RepID=UPI0006F983F2|nr:O-antigen ligase family protein [Mesorhizobium sp. Root157]KQZ94139.1 hypothetical protein ASD64_04490 [Mesorhizobium sp. Root157]